MTQMPPGSQYGYPARPVPQTSTDAVVALVLSLFAWATCPIVLAIVALVFASKANTAIKVSNGWVTGDGLVTAAKILAWANIVVFGLLALMFAVLVVFAAMTADPSGLTDVREAMVSVR